MLMRNTLVLLAGAVLTGCAGSATADHAPTPFDPVGEYAIRTTVQGSDVTGQLHIRGEPGDYGGYVYTDLTGRMDIRRFVLDGMTAELTLDSPDDPVRMHLTFHPEGTVAGRWSLGSDGGRIEGRRIRD